MDDRCDNCDNKPRSPTVHEFIRMGETLRPYTSQKMKASGLRVGVAKLDGTSLGVIYIDGDFTDDFKKVMLASIKHTLTLKKEWAQKEIREIDKFLAEQETNSE